MDKQDAAQEIARLEALIAIQGATLERYEAALQEITKITSEYAAWQIASDALKEAE